MTEQTGNSKPNEAEALAFPLSGNEKLIEEAAATIAVAELVSTHRTWGDLIEPQKDEYRRVARAVLAVFEKAHTPKERWASGVEPSDAYVLAALNRYYVPDGKPAQSLFEWSEGAVRSMRAILRGDFEDEEEQ